MNRDLIPNTLNRPLQIVSDAELDTEGEGERINLISAGPGLEKVSV